MSIEFGVYSYIGEGLYNPFDIIINVGKYTGIAQRLTIMAGQHRQYVSTFPFDQCCGLNYPNAFFKSPIVIGNDVWIGMNVSIMEGITIGDGAIIGASSVVAKDVKPYSIVIGNPVIIKRFRFEDATIKRLMKIKWWDWDFELIKERIDDFKDIELFLNKYDW
jgi:acetyltransferase-like isoleucine patch superfamily enzyme